jgi:hypothetical protein
MSAKAVQVWINDLPHPGPLSMEREARLSGFGFLDDALASFSARFSKQRRKIHLLLGGEGRDEGERLGKHHRFCFPVVLNQKRNLCKSATAGYLATMITVQEIEAAIPRLSRAQVEELRAWIDDFLEDQLELKDEAKAKLDQSRSEIAAGNYTTRQPMSS